MSSEHEKETLAEPTPDIDDDHYLTEEEGTPFHLRSFLKEKFWPELKYLVSEIVAHNRLKSRKKKAMGFFFLLITVLVFYDLLLGGYISSWLENFIFWMTVHSIEAVFAFVAIFVLSTLVLIPPTILIFGAGYAFAQAIGITTGIFAATLSCFLGSCIGAVIAFLRGRYMMRDLVQKFSLRYPLIRAADQALKRNGFHIMVLLRFCPLIPFNGLNYCCGITGVPVHAFVHSLVGILPFQFFTVIVGATAGTLVSSHSGLLGWIILICSGLIFGSIALVYIWRLVKQELQKELDLSDEEIDQFLTTTYQDKQTAQKPDDIEKGVGEQVRKSLEEADEEWFWVWA